MRGTLMLMMAALPLVAGGWDDGRRWKLDEKETIRRTFDVAAGSGARKLLVDNIHGFVHVTGTSSSQVQVSIEKHIYAESSEAMAEAKRDVRMDLSQQGNFVRCYEEGPFRTADGTHDRGDRYYGYRVVFDFDVQVPYDTELVLKAVNRDVLVKKTTGDYEIHGINGGIEMEDVAGSGLVSTINGKVKVTFSKNPAKATQFKTLNGSVDVYFQSGLNADLKFKKLNGGIYTDFDVAALPRPAEAGDSSNGRFVYRSDRQTTGRVGKGGPELSFDTLNGNIRLHSKAI
jgi:hypothetical protein